MLKYYIRPVRGVKLRTVYQTFCRTAMQDGGVWLCHSKVQIVMRLKKKVLIHTYFRPFIFNQVKLSLHVCKIKIKVCHYRPGQAHRPSGD